MGTAVGIIIGQMLGSGEDFEKIKDTDVKLITLSVMLGLFFGGIMAATSTLFPALYNTSEEVKQLASALICVGACYIPLNALAHSTYFTLRSGGKTLITFIFDSGFKAFITVPVTLILTYTTNLPIIPLFIICTVTEIFKCILGLIFVKSGLWLKNLATPEDTSSTPQSQND